MKIMEELMDEAPNEGMGVNAVRKLLAARWTQQPALLVMEDGNYGRVTAVRKSSADQHWRLHYRTAWEARCSEQCILVTEAEAGQGGIKAIVLGFFGRQTYLEEKWIRVMLGKDVDGVLAVILYKFQSRASGDLAAIGFEYVGGIMEMSLLEATAKMGFAEADPWPVEVFIPPSEERRAGETDEEHAPDEEEGGAAAEGNRNHDSEPDEEASLCITAFTLVRAALVQAGTLQAEQESVTVSDLGHHVKSISGRECTTLSEMALALSECEHLLESGKGSPEMKSLKRICEAGGMRNASKEERSRAVRQLVLQLPQGGFVAAEEAREAPPLPKETNAAAGSTRAASRPRAKPPSAPQKSRKQSKTPELGSDADSETSSSGSESDDVRAHTRQKARAGPAKKRRSEQVGAHTDMDSSADEPEEDTARVDLSRITPPDWTNLQAAAVVFESGWARSAAACEPVPAVPAEERKRMYELRYDKALARLCKVVGTRWLTKKAPASAEELFERVETMLDKLVQDSKTRQQREGRGEREGANRKKKKDAESSGDEAATKLSRAAGPLPASVETAACAADVAEQLHLCAAKIKRAAKAAGDNVPKTLAAMSAVEEQVLQRALSSNMSLSNQGERETCRREHPAPVHKLATRVREEIRTVIANVPLEDSSKTRSLGAEDCIVLAKLAQTCNLDFAAFAKRAGAMTGAKHVDCNTLEALADAWLLMKPAFETMGKQLNWTSMERGIALLDRKLNASARSTHQTGEQLKKFVVLVAGGFEHAMVRFRLFDGSLPSLEETVQEFEKVYAEHALENRLTIKSRSQQRSAATDRWDANTTKRGSKSPAARQSSTPQTGQSGGRRQDRGRDRSRSPIRPDNGRSRSPNKQQQARCSSSPDCAGIKRVTMPSDEYKTLLAEAAAKFTSTRKYWLLAKCSHGTSCTNGSHSKPNGLAAWVASKPGLSMA